jgi:hypothetical protein
MEILIIFHNSAGVTLGTAPVQNTEDLVPSVGDHVTFYDAEEEDKVYTGTVSARLFDYRWKPSFQAKRTASLILTLTDLKVTSQKKL